MNAARLEMAVANLEQVRNYTHDLLGHVDDADWFRSAGDHVTHVGWQVGHLAICEYALVMKRVCGEQAGDAELLPTDFPALFGKGSTPVMDASVYPSPQELRAALEQVHAAALATVQTLDPETLDEPTVGPHHPMFTTKWGALQWAVQHEFLHAGQIGLLRRQLGNAWIR